MVKMPKEYEKILYLNEPLLNFLEAALHWEEGDPEKNRFGEDDAWIATEYFEDGTEMDLKVCGVQYEEGSDNAAWSEAVLFRNGKQLACSDPFDEILGEWELADSDIGIRNIYRVIVKKGEK